MKTYSAKPADIERPGSLLTPRRRCFASCVDYCHASEAQTDIHPSHGCGDNVIVINAEKIQMTARARRRNFYWHTGHPGGSNSAKRTSRGQTPSGSA
jgi:large subunit ribosomal protein L13